MKAFYVCAIQLETDGFAPSLSYISIYRDSQGQAILQFPIFPSLEAAFSRTRGLLFVGISTSIDIHFGHLEKAPAGFPTLSVLQLERCGRVHDPS
jgi:hypothetical protein